MSELLGGRDAQERTRIENRRKLDAAERVVFSLKIPDKAKIFCLYLLNTCDWNSFTRDEGRQSLSQILACSEDQVSRYTRPLDQFGVIKIVGRGSNLSGRVHTYRIQLDHPFWKGEIDAVIAVADAIARRIKKGCAGRDGDSRGSQELESKASTEESLEVAARGIGRPRHAARGCAESRERLPNTPPAAAEQAANAALPLLSPSSPSPSFWKVGGENSSPEALPDFPSLPIEAIGLRGKTLHELTNGYHPITAMEMKTLAAEFGLVKPNELIDRFERSSQWGWGLRDRVIRSFSGKYIFHVTGGRCDHCENWCPADAEIVAVTLRNIVAERSDCPLSLEIKRLYPECWPNSSTGDQAVDEEKAALQWLKDPDRSGTHSDFLNQKRAQVLAGRPLSPKQRDAVINNWKRAIGG